MAQLPAEQRRSGRRLLIAGVAILLVAIGSLIFLSADASDRPTSPDSTPSQTVGPSTTPGGPDVGTPSPSGEPVPEPTPDEPTPDEAAAATEQSLIGQITALIGALTGLILAVTGMIRILRTRNAPE
jgi:hypothetical protein